MISKSDLSNSMSYVMRLLVLPLGALLIAGSPTLAHEEAVKDNELAEVRQELRELKKSMRDLQSVIERLADDQMDPKHMDARRVERAAAERARNSDKFTTEQIKNMAQRAGLNDYETKSILQLAERVDFDERRIELKFRRGELSDTEISAIKKLSHDNHRS